MYLRQLEQMDDNAYAELAPQLNFTADQIKQTVEALKQREEFGRDFGFLIILNDEEKMVGILKYLVYRNKFMIKDTLIFPEYQNQGFASGAASLVENFAKEAGAMSMHARVRKNNPRALRVLKEWDIEQDLEYHVEFMKAL